MITILQGDVIEQLRTLPDESVHCCVTSPPYWGLRDYSTNGQIGLEKTPEEYVAKMVQVFREVRRVLRKDGTVWLNLGSNYAGWWGNYGGENRGDGSQREIVTGSKAHQKSYDGLEKWRPPSSFMARRGARACGNDGKGQSDSPASDSACFDLCDECRVAIRNRYDRKSGKLQLSEQSELLSGETIRDNVHGSQSCSSEVVCVQASTNLESSAQRPLECSHCANCGACLSVLRSSSRDASLCARKASRNSGTSKLESERHNQDKDASDLAYSTITFPEFKAKDLVPIPWMVAMALQADGWWLRSDIIWAKPNPMPESVTDRPTKAHEYLFLLTKSANYFYDAEAIKEQVAREWDYSNGGNLSPDGIHKANGEMRELGGSYPVCTGNRNKRSVWTVATAPYPDAHFSTYPPDLIKPCILAGTSAKGCCAKCGSPWERVIEQVGPSTYAKIKGDRSWREMSAIANEQGTTPSRPNSGQTRFENGTQPHLEAAPSKTIGWQPTCECNLRPLTLDERQAAWAHDDGELGNASSETTPCTVLDPFAGSGTTGAVALELGRKAVLIELNPKYVELIKHRCNVTPGLQLAI